MNENKKIMLLEIAEKTKKISQLFEEISQMLTLIVGEEIIKENIQIPEKTSEKKKEDITNYLSEDLVKKSKKENKQTKEEPKKEVSKPEKQKECRIIQKDDKFSNIKIFYLTMKCNLACDYCYEKEYLNKDSFEDPTYEELEDAFVNFIKECNERGKQAVCVFFGGEPFLKKDLLFKLIRKAIDLKNQGYDFYISINTNGTIPLTNEEWELLKTLGNVSLEVSHDGERMDVYRKFPNGRGVKDKVEEFIERCNEEGVKLKISYTVNDVNIGRIIDDIIMIFDKFNPDRVILRVAWDYIDEEVLKVQLAKLKEIGLKNNWSICELTCEKCQKCKKEVNRYRYFIPKKQVDLIINRYTEEKFSILE